MNRLMFLRRSTVALVVAPAIAELEKWHLTFDTVTEAGYEPEIAVTLADRHFSIHAQILREYYLPAVTEHLNQHSILLSGYE